MDTFLNISTVIGAQMDVAFAKQQLALALNTNPLHLCGLISLVFVGLWFVRGVYSFLRIAYVLAPIPEAKGSVPILGHALCLVRDIPWNVVARWAGGLGGVARFRVLEKQVVVISDPKAVKRVFQTAFQTYAKDLDWSYHPFLSILGSGLVTADGQLWQTQRLLMTPTLRVDILDGIVEIAKRAVDRLCEKLEKLRGTGTVIEVEEEFRLLTLQVIGEAILSLPPEECDRVFPELYLPVMTESNRRVLSPWRKYLPFPSWFDYNRRVNQLNSYLIGILRERWAHVQKTGTSKTGDILDRILLHIKDKVADGEATWDSAMEQQLCYEVKTFLLAGHETSAAMLTWSVFELSQNKDALEKVRAEARQVFGPGATDKIPSKEQVDGMEYTLSTLKETLRKYSVVPVVTRRCIKDDRILDYNIPRGAWVFVSMQAVHDSWREPSKFSPERFMTGGEYDQYDEEVRPYMFLPFIAGPRNCLGQHLALLEARVVLGYLVHRFTLTPVKGAKAGERHHSIIPVATAHGLDVTIH